MTFSFGTSKPKYVFVAIVILLLVGLAVAYGYWHTYWLVTSAADGSSIARAVLMPIQPASNLKMHGPASRLKHSPASEESKPRLGKEVSQGDSTLRVER